VYRQRAGGGGGFGNPHERAAELVAEEVRAGVISAQSARDNYGVVVDEKTFAVDEAATSALRQGSPQQFPQRTTP
jgi:N-methylhydantoinase B